MKQNIKQKIAYNIAKLREQQGLTQLDLGISLGYQEENAQSRISQYETGSRSPGKNTLGKIAEILNVPADQLIREEAGTYESKTKTPADETDPTIRRLNQIMSRLDADSRRAVLNYAKDKQTIQDSKRKK